MRFRFWLALSAFAALACSMPLGCAWAADRPAPQTFNSNGTKLSFTVQGKGEPVILVHGWLSSGGLNWGLPGTSAQLAKNYEVITIDVRGHGQSDKPLKDEDYGPELVEDIVRLMDHLKLKKAHIVGYSMGGIITANFLAKHPNRALTGTLCGMGWLKDGELPQAWFAQIGKNDSNANAHAVCGRSLAKLAITEKEIKSIKVPVCVIVGSKDDLIKGLYVDPLKKVRDDWPVVEIKDGDHLSTVAKPQFKDEIAAWLKKNPSK